MPIRRRLVALMPMIVLACATSSMVADSSLAQDRSPIRDPERFIQRRVCSWKELNEQNVVMQKRDFSCGAAALATLLKYYWEDDVTELQILKQFDDLLTPEETRERIKNGLSMTDLRRVSVKMGYLASIGAVRFDQLAQSKVPLLVGITVGEFKHFVVVRGVDCDYVYLADPARGNIRVPISEFVRQWQKNAILVIAKKGQDPKDTSPLSVRAEEIYHGELNRTEVRKVLTRSSLSPPLLRP